VKEIIAQSNTRQTQSGANVFSTGPAAVVSAHGGTGTPFRWQHPSPGYSKHSAGRARHPGGWNQLHRWAAAAAAGWQHSHHFGGNTPAGNSRRLVCVFNNWSDAGALSHVITVSATPATYTVTLTMQYQLTLAVAPAGSGTVTPDYGGFYDAGASVTVTALANADYLFNIWTGAANPATSATTAVLMSAPESVTAGFVAQAASVLNGGSFQPGLAAPDTILTLFGANLGCTPAPHVLVNGVQAQMLFASSTQIDFVVPAGLGSVGNARWGATM
jgi:Divergent InlB B-repeat domain